ncbi:MAG: riboflavin biosynthesis protein RibF [Muribaculaceae bacterium]|nr:riboflavin biosynthesis protein RibF [Muribaculaceae bacterium]MDE6559579.1 riboflavin biosynthesis protein RibF [Muribaculaceae bacterium]
MNTSSPFYFPPAAESSPAEKKERYAVTIGTFDGLHRGHLRVLDTLNDEAARRGLTPMVITFDAHPLSVIAPERTPAAILSTLYKLAGIRRHGMKIHLLDFTPATARQSASDWIRSLHDYHDVDLIVIGYDNTFGHDGRSLSQDDYIRIGAEAGVEIIIADRVEGISSTAIRRHIAAGHIEKGTELLGHPFTLDGRVEEGDHIGRSLGVPTANIRPALPANRLIPPFGVYASRTRLSDGSVYPSVTNIGLRPTVRDLAATPTPRIETHLIGYDGPDLYGSRIEVELLSRMRDEEKFSSIDALKERLHQDIEIRKSMQP